MSLCLKPGGHFGQQLINFEVSTDPGASLNGEVDSFGNAKHILNLHREHESLEITARSTVETAPVAPLPHSIGPGAWEEIRSWTESFDHWDFTHPTTLTRPSPALAAFVDRSDIRREGDPMESLLAALGRAPRQLRLCPR